MRTHLAVALVALCSCSPKSSGTEPVVLQPGGPPVATKAPLAPPGDPEPQDLEPVETRKSYGARDPDPLLKDLDCEFSMVCMPSFTTAYAIALVSQGKDEPGEKLADRRWTVRFAADEPEGSRHLARGEDPRRLAEASVDSASALRLQRSWESVVRRTRYPRPVYEESGNGDRSELHRVGVDGTTYRFECGQYCGTTWCPRAELTWGIVELGDELRKYALLEEAARPAQLAHCLELAERLQAAAEKRTW